VSSSIGINAVTSNKSHALRVAGRRCHWCIDHRARKNHNWSECILLDTSTTTSSPAARWCTACTMGQLRCSQPSPTWGCSEGHRRSHQRRVRQWSV